MNDWRRKDEESPKQVNATEAEVENDPAYHNLFLLIQEDRERVKHESNLDEQPDLADRLEETIQSGISQAEKRSRRRRSKRASLQLVAVALSMLVLLTAFVRISPSFAAIVRDIPGFGRFVELIGNDQSLQLAIDNEYIQLVGKSDERNGYKFTVNGVLADAQRVVLVYSAVGPGINEEDTDFLNYELKDENGGNISAGISSSHFPQEVEDKDGGVQDYLDIMMSPGVPVPQEIQFKLEVGGEWLEVQVPIDHSRFAEMTEVISLNETIEVAGQRVEVTEAVITPLQVSITFKSDPENEMRLNDFIDLELVDDAGRSFRTNSGMGGLDTEIVRHFQSPYFQKPKSLTMMAKGLLMSDRGMKVVVDTEQEKLITAPDNRLKLSEVKRTTERIDLAFELSQEDDPQSTMRGINLFGHEEALRDAEGNVYSIERGQIHFSGRIISQFGSGSMDKVTYYYNIPNTDYVQPLTLDVEQYLGHELKDISIRIK